MDEAVSEPETSRWRRRIYWDETKYPLTRRWAWDVRGPEGHPGNFLGPFATGHCWTKAGATRRALKATPRRVP